VYDLVENKAPKNFFEAAEAGDSDMIIRMIERTLDFDVNQKVGHCTLHCQHVPDKLQPVPHLSLAVISWCSMHQVLSTHGIIRSDPDSCRGILVSLCKQPDPD
jgi:hypothetical protein